MIKGYKEKKTIGLVLENTFTEFGEEFIQNVQSGIRQRKDLNLVVIAGRFDGTKDKNSRHHRYFNIYNTEKKGEHPHHGIGFSRKWILHFRKDLPS